MFNNIIKAANNSNVINNNYPAIEKIIPISAEVAINTTGCSFFVAFILFVSINSNIANKIAPKLNKSNIAPLDLNLSEFNKDSVITGTPAAAISAVEVGLKE